ncbi:hypothetical protein [Streptomyces sp. DSM 40907]|uniref:hypothetical protein n=1 Tax=Streptomyces kutzneri TaxID=3051179 RepID=UPI0028D4FE0C|nr:hypothetical protein [Streptomyces sp. DSM 40907]
MDANCCSVFNELQGLKLSDLIPAPGYVLGVLAAWIIQIPRLSRGLFYDPPRTAFRPELSWRIFTTLALCIALGVDESYIGGILVGNILLTFAARFKTRLQLAGLILQAIAPILFLGLSWRILSLPGEHSKDLSGWLIAVALSFPTAGIFWAIPYGKSLYWRGSWDFPYPRSMPSWITYDPALQNPRYAPLLPSQNPIVGIFIWLVGWVCCAASIGLSLWALHRLLSVPIGGNFWGGLVILLIPAGVSSFNRCRKLFLMGRRHLKLPIASPNALHPGTYVLYLRSFEDDKARTALQAPLHTFGSASPPDLLGSTIGLVASSRDQEEHIAAALRPVGALVAVGAPDEILPFAGASRMYMPKTAWKQPVRELMTRARLVTIAIGSSAGTMWELSEAMRILPPQRLILFVPGEMSRKEYDTIRRTNTAALRDIPDSERNRTWKKNARPILPPCPSDLQFTGPVAGVIHFSADWEPTFTDTPTVDIPWGNLSTSLTRGLRPAFERLASYEEETGWHCG